MEVVEVAYGSDEFQQVVAVRMEVFVREQGVPEAEELDEFESHCVHLAVKDKVGESSRLVAVCRLHPCPPFVKLERVAVLKSHRGRGIGYRLNGAAIAACRLRWPRLLPTAHAQTTALPFYATQGFLVVSEEFLDEVSILHHTIILPDVKTTGEYELLDYDAPPEDNFIPGEYKDPDVVDNMKTALRQIMDYSLLTIDTVISLLSPDLVGAGLVRRFSQYAAAVCDHQLRTPPSLTGKMGMGVASEDEEELLLGMAWDKLNTGHYSEVDERWRRFYFAVSLLKSCRLKTALQYQAALRAFDMGLLMGGNPLDDDVIIKWAGHLQAGIGIEPLPPVAPKAARLPPPDLPQSRPVSESGPMSEEDFLERFLLRGSPVVIRGAAQQWPATLKWTFDWLHSEMGSRLVPVEVGSRYTDDNWAQRLMTAGEFFQQITSGEEMEEGPLYLAQHRLLDQIPQLKKDIVVPHYCLAGGQGEEDVDVNVWIGPEGTVSPLHTDPKDNLFCQIVGRKFVRLVAPADSDKVYAIEDGILTNTSQLDAEHPDPVLFPLFRQCPCLDVVVEPGDALFIPKGWWHHVRSLQPAVSLSFWFQNDLLEE